MELNLSDQYLISDNAGSIDFEQVRSMLTRSFWSPGIGTAEVRKGAENSALVVTTRDRNNAMIGYLRVISDKTRFAYILDVYVDEKHRSRGIARAMVRFALDHPDLAEVYQWILITRDAHEVYRAVGFGPLPEPGRWMCILKPRPER